MVHLSDLVLVFDLLARNFTLGFYVWWNKGATLLIRRVLLDSTSGLGWSALRLVPFMFSCLLPDLFRD